MHSRTATRMIGGRYRIGGLLGEGGMARVFDAVDERLGRRVAVKLLRPETEAVPGMRRRFQHEARTAARLAHPNIVAVLDYGEDDASSYLVMERLPGDTLRDEIDRGPLAPRRLAAVMVEVLAALELAHRRGVLHRDVKPSNVLLQEDGHVKLADFGIAKSIDAGAESGSPSDDLTMTGLVLGTPGYLAPERRSGRAASAQSDLYAVGAVMAEAMVGRHARTEDRASSEASITALGHVARRALAVDPADRFASARDMRRALAAVPPVQTNTAPLPRRPGRGRSGAVPARRVRRVIALVALSLVVLAALFVTVVGGSRPTGPAHSVLAHRVAGATTVHQSTTTTTLDAEASAIDALAASLASDGSPDHAALAAALEATAAEPAGPARQAAAQRTLELAGLLLGSGALTQSQYDDVVTTLEPTGASPTTAPGVIPSVPGLPGASGPAVGGPPQGPHHNHDTGPGSGQQH